MRTISLSTTQNALAPARTQLGELRAEIIALKVAQANWRQRYLSLDASKALDEERVKTLQHEHSKEILTMQSELESLQGRLTGAGGQSDCGDDAGRSETGPPKKTQQHSATLVSYPALRKKKQAAATARSTTPSGWSPSSSPTGRLDKSKAVRCSGAIELRGISLVDFCGWFWLRQGDLSPSEGTPPSQRREERLQQPLSSTGGRRGARLIGGGA